MAAQRLRCAIYTRKSTDEGLEQAFNSLDAQREACEAYVKSQASEGWSVLRTAYDDGGFSGGNLERPGLRRLLADIEGRRVDVVVVYKIDRLTRSLFDFAKLVEVLDRNGASFVSVTQAFNTTTSMGRLTLNVLLSFAQFEREVTAERIRDKIAASKRRGMWMGGNLPLGYDASGRTLTINEPEAEQVRYIFRRYLEIGSVHILARELQTEGVTSKRRLTKAGVEIGGSILSRGALFHLLSNRVYIGQVPHKKESYPGLHQPILDVATFEAVQDLLAQHRRRHGGAASSQPASLAGRIFDADGKPMSRAGARGKSGQRYFYYVSTSLQRGARSGGDGIRRIPCAALDPFIFEVLRRLLAPGASVEREALVGQLVRIDVASHGVRLTVQKSPQPISELRARLFEGEDAAEDEDGRICIAIPVRLVFRGGRSWMTATSGTQVGRTLRPDRALISGLRRAHRVVAECAASPLLPPRTATNSRAPASPYLRALAPLAYLAPDIQAAILEGRQPAGLTLQQLIDDPLALDWSEQRRVLGFSSWSAGADPVD